MSDRFKTPGCGTFSIIIAVLALLGFGGWRGYLHFYVGPRQARIQEFSILITGHLDMTLVFKEVPTGGDPRDVRIVLASEALTEGELSLAWADLAPTCFAGGDRLSPDQPPPLGVPITVRRIVGNHFERKMSLSGATISNFNVTAKLFWGGTQQDRASTTVLFNYQPTTR
jgi:hypothetical protein